MILKSQFFWRTYLSYLALVLAGILIFAAFLVQSVSRQEVQRLERYLKTQGEVLEQLAREDLGRGDSAGLQARIDSFSQAAATRFTIIDQSGKVLADSHESPHTMNNHLQRPEVLDALDRGWGIARRFSQTLQEEYYYYAIPLFDEGRFLGLVRASLATVNLKQDISAAQAVILKIAAWLTVIALLVAFYLAARQAAPVENITHVAQVIAGGDFERRLPLGRNPGFNRLAEVINELARNSAQRVSVITSDRNRLNGIFAGMVEGVFDVDQDKKILHINEAAAKLLGVSPTACLNKPVWEEIRNREIVDAIDASLKKPGVIKTQMRLSRKSDDLVVDIYAASLSNDDGELIGAVVVLNDITELMALERVRTDFVANASHELKTPITAIRGLSETILGDDSVEKETLVRFIERIHAQSLRLSQLVGDLMTISRLESVQKEAEFSELNMADLVKRAVKAADANREYKGQSLTLELPEERLPVLGDNQNLSQLVDNLIDNAIKYTQEGGHIRVALSRQGDKLQLEVEDNGIGISPQYQQRVFERFYRVDKARSQSLGGTGLGLSIVKNIAEKHGGSISLVSQLGRGSKFTVELPAA